MSFVSAGADGLVRWPFKNWVHEVFIKTTKNPVIISPDTSEMSQKKNFASIKLQIYGKMKR